MNCDCKEWRETIKYDGCRFRFCPWCSKSLKESEADSVGRAPDNQPTPPVPPNLAAPAAAGQEGGLLPALQLAQRLISDLCYGSLEMHEAQRIAQRIDEPIQKAIRQFQEKAAGQEEGKWSTRHNIVYGNWTIYRGEQIVAIGFTQEQAQMLVAAHNAASLREKEEQKTLGGPDAPSNNVNSPRQITRELLSEIANALIWLDEFVEMPAEFPSEGDVQWWRERRDKIRGLARKLNLSAQGVSYDAGGVSFPKGLSEHAPKSEGGKKH